MLSGQKKLVRITKEMQKVQLESKNKENAGLRKKKLATFKPLFLFTRGEGMI